MAGQKKKKQINDVVERSKALVIIVNLKKGIGSGANWGVFGLLF